MSVLVTGGGGYIGSHMVWHLIDAGERRNRSRQFLDRLRLGGAAGGPDRRTATAATRRWSGASSPRTRSMRSFISPGRSWFRNRSPSRSRYYLNNTVKSRALIESAVKAGVPHFIFSSTAAVYGTPAIFPVREDAPLRARIALRPVEADDRDDARRRERRPRLHLRGAPLLQRRRCRSQGAHRPIDPRGDPPHQGRLRDGARQAPRHRRSSATTTRRPTAPASATISTSPTSSRPMPTRFAISAPAATTSSPIAAMGGASRCSRCSTP